MKTYEDFIIEVQKEKGDSYMISALDTRAVAARKYARYCCEETLKSAASRPDINTQNGYYVSISSLLSTPIITP